MGLLEGKVAFITGAARGQGRSHAIRLAEEGADIVAVDICANLDGVPYDLATPADMAETVAAVEATGRGIVAAEADVRDIAALEAALADGIEAFGRLDVVCANAGISAMGMVEQISEDAWSQMIDINLTGVWHSAKVAIPRIREGGRGGAIVLISSAAGLVAYPGCAHYVAAKHGLVGLTKAMALELAPERIRVNSIHPTQVDTPMIMNEATKRVFVPAVPDPTEEEFAAVSQARNALPIPWVDPADISAALIFLASEEGRFITGAALPVDAGTVLG
jgi:SDR family mycofactocin-dependent oxidoreductase